MLKLYYLHKICHNSDMFRCILIIFRKLPNITKVYKNTDGLLNTLNVFHKMSVEIIKFVCRG
jgi:hypothetical protein